jgi:hypothetical protein
MKRNISNEKLLNLALMLFIIFAIMSISVYIISKNKDCSKNPFIYGSKQIKMACNCICNDDDKSITLIFNDSFFKGVTQNNIFTP